MRALQQNISTYVLGNAARRCRQSDPRRRCTIPVVWYDRACACARGVLSHFAFVTDTAGRAFATSTVERAYVRHAERIALPSPPSWSPRPLRRLPVRIGQARQSALRSLQPDQPTNVSDCPYLPPHTRSCTHRWARSRGAGYQCPRPSSNA